MTSIYIITPKQNADQYNVLYIDYTDNLTKTIKTHMDAYGIADSTRRWNSRNGRIHYISIGSSEIGWGIPFALYDEMIDAGGLDRFDFKIIATPISYTSNPALFIPRYKKTYPIRE